jgi:MFS family permease
MWRKAGIHTLYLKPRPSLNFAIKTMTEKEQTQVEVTYEKPSAQSAEEGENDAKYELPCLGKFEELFEGISIPPPFSEERIKLEKNLKRKIDLTILPIVILMYILNYLDRNNIAAAKLGTLEQDLHLTSSQYSTCQAILFLGYISMSVPSNLILARIGRPNLYLPSCMLVWGLLSVLIGAAVHNFGSMVVLRIFLGAVEAAFYPGVMFYLSCWYTRAEIAKRAALFVCGSWLSGAFSGLIAWGVMDNMNGVRGLPAWRWLFIIEGAATMGVALIAMAVLPQLPATTRWLSKEERLLGVVRMIEDVGTADDDFDECGEKMTAFRGLKLALTDKKIWLFFPLMFATCTAAGINAVFPTIVRSLGYSTSTTYLLTAPPWLFVSITSVLNSYHSDKTGERFYHALVGPTVSLAAFILGIATDQTAARYVCMMLILQIYASYSLLYAWVVSNLPRPPVKRAAAIGFLNVGANLPNLFVPYLFYNGSAPQFYAGFGVCIAFLVVAISITVSIRLYLAHLNKKLCRGMVVDGMDLTTGFRFTY